LKLVVSISSIYKILKQKYTTKEDLEEFEKMDEVDVAMIKHKKLSQKKSRKKYRLDQGADEQLAIE